jgi:hypothetical protein
MTNQQADPLPPIPETGESKRIRGNRNPVMPGYLEVVLIATLIVAGALFAYDRYFTPKISVIDMVGYVRDQKALLASGTITTEQLSENLKRLDDGLKSLPSNQTVILKDVVLNNGRLDEISIK